MPDTTSAVKDMEDSKEICRTCLQNICDGDADVHMLNSVAFPTPERTYVDILTDLGKLKIIDEEECNFPQRICSECCNKIRQMYLFIVQVQQCNAKLFQKFACKSVTSENMKFVHEVEENGNNKMEDIGESLDAKSYKLLLLKPNFLEVDIETPAGMECGFEETDFDAIQDPAETFHNIPSNAREVCSEPGDDKVTTHEEKEIKNTIDTPTSCKAKSTSASGCFSCSYCKKILGSHETLKKHIRKHQNERKVFFTCVYCTRKFPNQHSLNVHLIHKHDVDRKDTMKSGQYTIEGEKFKCQLCDYSSRTYAAFYFHKRSKHGTEEDKIKCKFCSYTNVKKFEMFVHMKNLHLSAVKTLRRNFLKKASVRDTPEEHDRELSDFVNKFPEHINPKNNNNTKKTNFKRRIKETCSSGDEEFIRDMLDIKKRTPKSKRKRQVLLEMGKPRTDSKSNALITRSANQNPVRNICASHETDNTSCPLCEKVLMCDDLVTHMLLEHREECSSRPTENLRESQPNEELYSCKHCHVECSDQSELTNHILEHHRSLFKDTKIEDNAPIKKKVLKCHVCDYTTTTHAGIHYHIRSKHGTEDDKFKCNFCSYKCYKKFDLLHHTKRNHLAIIKEIKRSIGMPMQSTSSAEVEDITSLVQKFQDYTVNVDAADCNMELSSGDEDTIRDILDMKKRYPKSESTKSFARRCEECGNVYKDSIALKTHVRMVHREHEYSQCPHCPRKYKRSYDLKLHIKVKHMSNKEANIKPVKKVKREKRFMCTECSYVCTTLTCLTIHTHRHHTGEKPFQCEFCPKAYVVKADLKTHRYLHTGERPFKCPICLKGFRDKNHMHRHKHIHNEIKPYSCLDCGKGFSKNYNLTIHMRTHMKDQQIRCLVCGKYFKDRVQLNVHQISEDHHEEVDE